MDDRRGGGNQIDDSWWAALAIRMLHPVEVQIIEALWDTDQPLSAGELFRACGERPPWLVFAEHVRRLTKLRVIELAEFPSEPNPLETPFRLVVPRPGEDR